MKIRLELLKDHRDTAKSLFDLGMVHKEKGDLQRAKECLERSQDMQKRVQDDQIKDLQRQISIDFFLVLIMVAGVAGRKGLLVRIFSLGLCLPVPQLLNLLLDQNTPSS